MSDKFIQEILENRLLPIDSQKAFVKTFVTHPVHYGLFVFATIAQYFGLIQSEMPKLPIGLDLTFYVMRIFFYFLFMFFAYPYLLRIFSVRRIPFVVMLFLGYCFYFGMYFLIFGRITSNYTDAPTLKRYINNIIPALPFIILIGIGFGKKASNSLFGNVEMYPALTRYKISESILLEKTGDPEESPIRYIEAKSPYVVVVTEAGRDQSRMPFSQAVKLVENDTGWKIHRSVWVAKSEVESVRFVSGNPKVYLHDGTELPATRSIVKTIDAYLKANSHNK